jgi:hypothetical protein
LAKTELVPATVSGALKSTTAIAIAVSATPMASAARTPGAVRVADCRRLSGMREHYGRPSPQGPASTYVP